MISIIICVYDYWDDVVRALESCDKQLSCHEIILVDDGSRVPPPPVVVEAMRCRAVKYIRHHQNYGLSVARNTGIGNAEEKLIYCLDSDNYIYEHSLSSLYNTALQDGPYSVWHGNMKVETYRDGKVVATRMAVPMNRFDRASLLSGPPVWTGSLFTKKAWSEVGGFKVRKEKIHYDDWNFWIRVHLAGHKFKYVNETVYVCAEREQGICRSLESRKDYFVRLATEDL